MMRALLGCLLASSLLSPVAFAQIGPPGGGGSSGSGCTVSGTTNGLVSYNGSSGCNVSSLVTIATAASGVAALTDTGSIFTGGGTTNTLPHYFFQPTGTTAAGTWSNNGTLYGANFPTGFTGNILDTTINGSATHGIILTGAGAATFASFIKTTILQLTSAGASEGAITSAAAGQIQLGLADAAAPVAQTLSAQSVVAGTSNTAGANELINGSRGTGTGAGGSVTIQTASAGSAGSTVNALAAAATFDNTQFAILGSGTPTCGTGCASIAAGATNQRMIVTSGSAVTSIAVAFSKTLLTAPICTASEIAGTPLAIGFSAAPTTSGFTLTAASALTTAQISVLCQ